MGQDIKNFVVAICDQHSKIWGTGFVIAPGVVVTCAHVIAAGNVNPGETIYLKLPDETILYEAEVLTGSYDFNNDVAILSCRNDLPATIQPAILGRWQEAKHTSFYSYGYRPLDDYRGNPAEGRFLREVADILPLGGEAIPTHPVLSLSSQQVSSGMSGSPVYIPATDRVVGMITAIWNSADRDRDTAFAVSAEAISAACPGVSLRPQLNKLNGLSSETEGDPLVESKDTPLADGDTEFASRGHSLTSTWIETYLTLLPIPHGDDAIDTTLKGFSPFPHHRAEGDLPFLFGPSGGFWSSHPVYAQVVGNPVSQVVLADNGAGQTAFACALRQVGLPDGNPMPHSLPILLAENDPVSPNGVAGKITRTVSAFVKGNASVVAGMPPGEQKYIERFCQTAPKITTRWLKQTQAVLRYLGFRQIVLAFDASNHPVNEIKIWLDTMPKWSGFSINPVLFLPLGRQQDMGLSERATVRVLTWTERQLTAMATWRFERLVNGIGVRILLEELFEDDMFTDFVRLSNRNPGRMAYLWAKMAEHHRETNPAQWVFTWDNLGWATEQVN